MVTVGRDVRHESKARIFKTKTAHAAFASVKPQARKPASSWETAPGGSSRVAIDQRPDVPGYPPAQAAQ